MMLAERRIGDIGGTTSVKTAISAATPSRILVDIPCRVCTDHSSGKHYGIYACDGCAGFFKRSVRRSRQYVCKSRSKLGCPVDKTHRNQCRACRLKKCLEAGMNREAVQHERGPRNATIRRHMALYLKDSLSPGGGGRTVTSSPSFSSESPSPTDHLLMLQRVLPAPVVGAFGHPSTMGLPFSQPKVSPPMEAEDDPAHICELAARILFMSVRWLRSLPAFLALPPADQLTLLQNSWLQLFMLSACFFQLPVNSASLLRYSGLAENDNDEDNKKAAESKRKLQLIAEMLEKFRSHRLDPTELSCLKALLVFKTDWNGLTDNRIVSSLQDQAQLTLARYHQVAYPHQPERFGKLLLLLPELRNVCSETIEKLYFRKTTGDVSMNRLLTDMYSSGQI